MYVIMADNKILAEAETYDDACDKALAIEYIYNTSVYIKEKDEHTDKKYGNA